MGFAHGHDPGPARDNSGRYCAGTSTGNCFRLLAGLLWDQLGPAVTFYAGAVFSLLAIMMLVPGKTDQKSRGAAG